jgi:hydroxyacylglutathione hydrolase
MKVEILLVPALSDNYIFVIRDHESEKTIVVDPAEAAPVLSLLQQKKWKLDYIINTHHHSDHIGGNLELKNKTQCKIICSILDEKRILKADQYVVSGQEIKLGHIHFKALEMIGHTLGHIAYYSSELGVLFSGDVLFGLGCGRVFEGTYEQMKACMDLLHSLPPETRVYCSHEYTERNLAFALSVDGENQILLKRAHTIKELRLQNISTVPLNLGEEFKTNPFLRIYNSDFLRRNNYKDALSAFTDLRQKRNNF